MHIPLSPYLLLVLTTLFWAGNFVLGRAVHASIPPVSLVFWRWAGALLILLPFTWRHVRDQWPLLRHNWKALTMFAFLGVFCFNTFVYIALQSTTATNAILLNSIIPIAIVALSRLFGGTRVTQLQAVGMAISFAGVITIISRADLDLLLALRVNRGDLWVLLAVACWALYTFLLRQRPAGLHPLSFLTSIVALGLLGLAPLYAWELGQGLHMAPGPATWASLLYVAFFPSVLAFIFWNQAVGQVGANRAGLFLHLMPVFGTLLSIMFLGESLHLFQVTGIGLIFSGIWLTTRA
ncbi:DMT family transporter [Geobacter sp. SVR]|uniref:DMT family transporter n=1 Tax=Geobacter sp. SVR TaxID=2495594 RepID=UPI00143F0320|nr:DMT family transporter [Geobacter sp. SVR]BCS52931.1 multidrug DMT transporter permease [Geobacter sp. SVR]GCF84315.1 multidrug DMT transporter permease [Geobacter sp. SVR]